MTTPMLDSLVDELSHAVRECPHAPFIRMRDSELTFQQFDVRSNQMGHVLQELGVGTGDRVSVLLPNCIEAVLIWFGLAKLTAISAPVNTGFKGRTLLRVLDMARSEVLIVHHSLLPSVEEIRENFATIRRIYVVGTGGNGADSSKPWCESLTERLSCAALDRPAAARAIGTDLTLLLYTSGTTGGSKAAMISHRFALVQGRLMVQGLGLRKDDVLYCPYPLFHLDATVLTVVVALVLRGVAAIGERFSASKYWDEVRALGATVFDFMGATITMLWKQPPTARDKDHSARLGWGVPLPSWAPEFEARFGCQLVELYGLTESGVMIYTPLDQPRRLGSCGRLAGPYDAIIVDDHGFEVPRGSSGELVIRPREPSVMMDGYYGMPNETLNAFRNLWFHTGDLLKQDDDGYFYFTGRRKDVVRRRGENISSSEVELAINDHPNILESCVFGVPSELTEEEVMTCLVLRHGVPRDAMGFHEAFKSMMSSFMVPRYIRFMDELPKTPTDKVEKHVLQAQGVTSDTWDAEAPLSS